MFDQILARAEGLQTGFIGFVLNNWVWIAVALIVLGFALDQALYFKRYKPWRRWMHNLRVCRRFLERIFHTQLPWPPDRKPQPAAKAQPASETEDDPDAPNIVRTPVTAKPAQPLKPPVHRAIEDAPKHPVDMPYQPLPRPAQPSAKAQPAPAIEDDLDAPNIVRTPVTVKPAQPLKPPVHRAIEDAPKHPVDMPYQPLPRPAQPSAKAQPAPAIEDDLDAPNIVRAPVSAKPADPPVKSESAPAAPIMRPAHLLNPVAMKRREAAVKPAAPKPAEEPVTQRRPKNTQEKTEQMSNV